MIERKKMERLKRFKWALLIYVLALVGILYFATMVDAETVVPTHWNVYGEVDGTMSKNAALYMMIGMLSGIFLLMYLMPQYSPWYAKHRERMERLLPLLTAILCFCLGFIGVYSFYLAGMGSLKTPVSMITVVIGAIFILLGNLLPKVPKNFFVGIRTPWTLVNDKIWTKTHRLGGGLFVLSGILMVVKSFIMPELRLFHQISGVMIMALLLYPLLHSFILYKRS